MIVLVFTTGLSGSSLLTSLIARDGFCTGETLVKAGTTGNYNTHENAEFVKLNTAILAAANVLPDQLSWYDAGNRASCESVKDEQIAKRCLQFLSRPGKHGERASRAVLKDPRLWTTIGFWSKLLDKNSTRAVIAYRNPFDLWVSQTNKRIIYDRRFLADAEASSRSELQLWLEREGVSSIQIETERLQKHPAEALRCLNEHLGTQLQLEDFEAVYNSPPRMKKWRERLLAPAIYLKNYRLRIKASALPR